MMLALVGRCVRAIQSSKKPRRMSNSTNRADEDCLTGTAVGVKGEDPTGLWESETQMRHSRGCRGASSRALHCELKPFPLCAPSQKGLFSARPQRQREITERPPRP